MKDTAMTFGLILCPDEAMMQFDKVFTNCQTQTQTIGLAYQACIHAMKTLENALQMIGGNALTFIADTNLQHVLQSRCGRYAIDLLRNRLRFHPIYSRL